MRRGPKAHALALLLVTLVAFGTVSVAAQAVNPKIAADVYVTQNASGSGDGKSCANGRPATFFNSPANWGPGKAIAPGKTVALCGTITSTLTAQASGVPGHPISIVFAPGATIGQPACSPCLSISNRRFVVVDGRGTGIIESTDNGTHRGLHVNSTGINAHPCDDCEIKGLTIQNIYVHDGSGNNVEIDQTFERSIYADGSNLRITHNVIHDAGWSVFIGMADGDHNIRVDHNDIFNVDHGVITSSGTAGGSFGPLFVDDNHFHDFGAWDTSSNSYHHDGIHCYTAGTGGVAMHIGDFYIYNNRFDGSIGGNATSWVFIEGGSGGDRTPCADATSRIWLFNNFGTLDHHLFNGVFGLFSGVSKVYNNTLVGHGTASGTVCSLSTTNGTAFQNNVCATGNTIVGLSRPPNGSFATGSPDYNVYANGGTNAFVCSDGALHFWDFQQFSLFKRCVGGDSHSKAPSDSGLDTRGVPQKRSPVLGAGLNLLSLCKGDLRALCYDIDGRMRPYRMRPDVGAYQAETAALTFSSIGQVRLGASRQAVQQFYGPGQTYRRHGGLLKVVYAGGKVASISTTSQYYSTASGFGVGAKTSSAILAKSGWRACDASLVKRRGERTMAVRIARGQIAALTIGTLGGLRCR